MTKSNSEKKDQKFPSPFTENFIPAWDEWKAFKKEQFRFTYKPIGEKGALEALYELSAGNEQMAHLIIKQSIANGWRGLFDLKTISNATHIANTPAGSQQNGTSGSRIEALKKW